MEDKKYYWIKLKTDFFSNNKPIEFLLSQKNGCEYVVLYQMLCLMAANSNGTLVTKIGEMIIPYDIDKIVRDTKFFDFDTVTIGLELFKKLGLIYEQDNEILKISDFEEMVGCETSYARKMRNYRDKKKKLDYNVADNVTNNVEYNVRQENKSIEYRDKSIDNINNNIYIYTTTNNNIYNNIESNFGRTLSSFEVETINSWLQSFDENIVNHAVRIAVLNNIKTFNYVNGILKNWKAAGYKTLQEIKDAEDKTINSEEKSKIEIFDYDWLNDEASAKSEVT